MTAHTSHSSNVVCFSQIPSTVTLTQLQPAFHLSRQETQWHPLLRTDQKIDRAVLDSNQGIREDILLMLSY
jgi:hypothetical protein